MLLAENGIKMCSEKLNAGIKKLEEDILTAFTLDGVKKWDLAYGDAWMNNFDGSRGTATYYNGKL